MVEKIHSDERRIRRMALVLAIGAHIIAGIVAWMYYLDDPEKEAASEVISLSIDMPAEFKSPSRLISGGDQQARSENQPPQLPPAYIALPVEPEQLGDLPLTPATAPVPAIRERFSKELLSSMSEEEAFDSLMVLLDEYPEFRQTIMKKMVAGKGIDRIPDLYVSTGIRDYHRKMKFKTKYEYEAMRQHNLYGPYHDPVNGPWGYKKTGVQVNMIELVSWLVDLIGGKK